MNLRLIGLNHETASLDVREILAFTAEQAQKTLTTWQDHFPLGEAVLLSTCNRTEFYVAASDQPLPSAEELLVFLLQQKALPQGISMLMSSLAPQTFSFDNFEAAKHLFRVTAGLDSMVLGDAQILGQVRSAYQTAMERETAGPVTHALFQTALNTAKTVASHTDLHKHRVSVPSIAVVDFAMQIFERLEKKHILLLGAGKMGKEILENLCYHGATTISITSRNEKKAQTLAKNFQTSSRQIDVRPWTERWNRFEQADIIVSATSASETIVTLEDFRSIEKNRAGKTLFVLDLAVPRDFDPKIAECKNVYLYSLDDLEETCNKNKIQRSKEIPKAERIVQKSAEQFMRNHHHRQSGAVIQELRAHWDEIKQAELNRLFKKLPSLNEDEHSEIRYAFERLVGKFLHPPMQSLREESHQGVPARLLEALTVLFQLRGGK